MAGELLTCDVSVTRCVGEPRNVTPMSNAQVPPHVHFLWTGPGFALCQRLAIESVLLSNPELSVTLHLIEEQPPRPAARGNGDLELLRERPGVTVRTRTPQELLLDCHLGDQLWQIYQRIPKGAASAKSNVLRYAILWREGGIYLDLDVLVVRSLAPLRERECTLGTELVWSADEARVAGRREPWMIKPSLAFAAAVASRRLEVGLGARLGARWHRWLERRWSAAQPNNAVIAAAPRARFLTALIERAPSVDATVRFRLGPTLVTEVARQEPALVTLLDPQVLYFVPPSQSFRFFHDGALTLPERALLIHYVSSNHKRELGEVARRGLTALPPSMFRALASAVSRGRAPLSA
jgi:Glycosyltransferase sugar-binding region containing DXD motif